MFTYEPLVKTLKVKGLGIGELAEKTGLHASYLIARMNGGEYLPVEVLDRICSELKCDIGEVIKWREGKQNVSERVAVDWSKVTQIVEGSGMSLNQLSKGCRLSECSLSLSRKRGGTLKRTVVKNMAELLKCRVEDLV